MLSLKLALLKKSIKKSCLGGDLGSFCKRNIVSGNRGATTRGGIQLTLSLTKATGVPSCMSI